MNMRMAGKTKCHVRCCEFQVKPLNNPLGACMEHGGIQLHQRCDGVLVKDTSMVIDLKLVQGGN